MADRHTVSVHLTPEEVVRLDEIRGEGISRSAFVRELLRRAAPLDEEPNYPEALILLAKSARAGKVQAQVALERALRASEGLPEPWIARGIGSQVEVEHPAAILDTLRDGRVVRAGLPLGGSKGRRILSLDLFEISRTATPMVFDTRVLEMKGAVGGAETEGPDFDSMDLDELREASLALTADVDTKSHRPIRIASFKC